MKTLKEMIVEKLIIGLLCFLYFNNASSQESDNDAYYFANKIMQLTKNPKDSIYYITKSTFSGKGLLKKYYDFRFKGEPFYKTFTYDSINDIVGIDSLQLKNLNKWENKYRILNSTFTKNEIKHYLDAKETSVIWDCTDIVFNKKKDCYVKFLNHRIQINSISKPFYNSTKKYALVMHNVKGISTTFYIFIKEDEDWLLIDTVDDVGR